MSSKSKEALVSWAEEQAVTLEQGLRWETGEYGIGGWWTVDTGTEVSSVLARATAAMEFLRRYAGADSTWYLEARNSYDTSGGHKSKETGCRNIAPLLRGWAEQVRRGIVDIPQATAGAQVELVSTDLMEQVRRLNDDRTMNPAAGIVLAGAGLEVALRAVADAQSFELTEKPSLGAWGRLLRQNQILTVQDMKDVEQIAGLRNLAAHGQFDDLSRDRAGLMEQQVNILLSKLENYLSKE